MRFFQALETFAANFSKGWKKQPSLFPPRLRSGQAILGKLPRDGKKLFIAKGSW